MKKSLHKLASLVCLLTLLLGSATCLHAQPPKQSSCSHCPKHQPPSHTPPSCCAAQQQPPAITSAVVEHSVQFHTASMPLLPLDTAPLPSVSVSRAALPPPTPPRIALRI